MVEPGTVAVSHYVARIAAGGDAGRVFHTTDVDVALEEGRYHDHQDDNPLAFRVGDGSVNDGIDEAVRAMAVGDERTVRVSPEDAYGVYVDD